MNNGSDRVDVPTETGNRGFKKINLLMRLVCTIFAGT